MALASAPPCENPDGRFCTIPTFRTLSVILAPRRHSCVGRNPLRTMKLRSTSGFRRRSNVAQADRRELEARIGGGGRLGSCLPGSVCLCYG